MEGKNVFVERIFNANRQLVWQALTEKEMIKQWYFDLAEFKAEIGFKFEFWNGEERGEQFFNEKSCF
ncbi:SRPBCC family protein [Olivibacter sitiensis]|uniref:SRPBCC family protein n=1 Tax=Olivibacter sitiensis TaxID=376470 RepID=UPI00040E35A2|nr:SRPBCC domain-containing protein [Olivibacter sitiensis]